VRFFVLAVSCPHQNIQKWADQVESLFCENKHELERQKDPTRDFNEDGVIDSLDLIILMEDWGKVSEP